MRVKSFLYYVLLLLVLSLPLSVFAEPMRIVIATAGPGNVSHLPVDLMKKIGADKAEGVDLQVRYFGGGPLAVKDMLEKNSDFVVMGMPALATFRLKGDDVISLATVNRVPTFVLMVRSDLKGKVRKVSDLKGRTVGVNTSLKSAGKSTSQQIAEFMFKKAAIDPAMVNFVPGGQSYDEQSAVLSSKTVDALMGDEPFASRLKAAGKVFFLADMHKLEVTRKLLGGLFMNAQLATRADVLKETPQKAEKMAAVLKRTLLWIQKHSASQIIEALDISDPAEKTQLAAFLSANKAIYSPDGKITDEQILTAERFFHDVFSEDAKARALRFDSFVEPRFVGRSQK
jgi:NitT/TauT family transport system substrate-binding protein